MVEVRHRGGNYIGVICDPNQRASRLHTRSLNHGHFMSGLSNYPLTSSAYPPIKTMRELHPRTCYWALKGPL